MGLFSSGSGIFVSPLLRLLKLQAVGGGYGVHLHPKNTKKMGDIMYPVSSTYKDFEKIFEKFSNVFVLKKFAVPLRCHQI